MQLQPGATTPFPMLALVTPGALFLLMALFWTLDMPRYVVYGPLFLVGKGLSIITTLFWIFFADTHMIIELLGSAEMIFAAGVIAVLVPGDMISTALVIKIMRRQTEV